MSTPLIDKSFEGMLRQMRREITLLWRRIGKNTKAGAGTTAERDALYGIPGGSVPAQVDLANSRVVWFNTDLGWEESFYAPSGSAGLTVIGLVAGAPAAWYPTGTNGPEVRMEPTASAGVTNGVNIPGWTGSTWRRGGSASFAYIGTYQCQVFIPGYYDVYFWTNQQAGGGTADYMLRHVNAAGNGVPRYVSGLAYTLVSDRWTRVHGELNHELFLTNERFDTVCVYGTLAVHQGSAEGVRGQMGARYIGPPLVTN